MFKAGCLGCIGAPPAQTVLEFLYSISVSLVSVAWVLQCRLVYMRANGDMELARESPGVFRSLRDSAIGDRLLGKPPL